MIACERTVLTNAAELLARLDADQVVPAEALAATRVLAARFSGIQIDLLWDQQAFDRSFHYDLLISTEDGATLSLGYARDDGVPWPLRGVQRASERALLRVDGDVLAIDQAIGLIDFVWDDARIATRLIDACIVRRELQRHPIEIEPHEIDRAVAAFARTRGLETPSDLADWLHAHDMTHGALRTWIEDGLAATKLRRRVIADRTSAYFESNQRHFDRVTFLQVPVAGQEAAHELIQRVKEENAAVWSIAGELLATMSGGTGDPHLETISRRDAGSVHAAFDRSPGDVIGPVETEGQPVVLVVIANHAATLSREVVAEIDGLLFDEWLAGKRAAAAIEWFWGTPARTAAIGGRA